MKPKVAVIEDNPDNRLLVQALLEDTYEIVVFETGVDAVRGLLEEQPELVLLDISLPEMDGTEVLQWIRQQETLADVPVVALTAHAMAGDRDRFLEAGFDDYLAKPIVDEDVLFETISRWIGDST